MTEKILTIGQVAKLHKTSLKEIKNWLKKLELLGYKLNPRNGGLVRIPNDGHGRWGIPDSIAKLFPEFPKAMRGDKDFEG